MKFYIGIDVGGTYIKSAIVNSSGSILNDNIFIDYSCAKGSKDAILENFTRVIDKNMDILKDSLVSGVGLGFPGPFDYERGISKISNIEKYDEIYNVNIKEFLLNYFKENYEQTISMDFDIRFENDAAMFALGEYSQRNFKNKRVFTLCIGTGAGSAYIVDEKIYKYDTDEIKCGWIYNVAYGESIIDNYISSRGIIAIAKKKGIQVENVKEISELALQGDKKALEVWYEFEKNLYEVFKLATDDFKPEVIVIGGQISKSHNLFLKKIKEYFNTRDIEIIVSENTSKSTIIGAKMLFK